MQGNNIQEYIVVTRFYQPASDQGTRVSDAQTANKARLLIPKNRKKGNHPSMQTITKKDSGLREPLGTLWSCLTRCPGIQERRSFRGLLWSSLDRVLGQRSVRVGNLAPLSAPAWVTYLLCLRLPLSFSFIALTWVSLAWYTGVSRWR